MPGSADLSAFTRPAVSGELYIERLLRFQRLRRRHCDELSTNGINLLNNLVLFTWNMIRDLGMERAAHDAVTAADGR